MLENSGSNVRERRSRRLRWGLLLAAAPVLAWAAGCGGGDSAGTPPASGGGAGTGGSAQDGSVGGTGGVAGTSGQGGTHDAGPDAKGGSGGSVLEAGDETSETSVWCTSDLGCKADPAKPVCDVQTGQCVQCKPSDPNACQAGHYCDPDKSECLAGCDSDDDCAAGDAGVMVCNPATHQCVGCHQDSHCPAGQICDTGSTACKPGCTAQHACDQGLACCSGQCINTQSDYEHCGTCANACSLPNAWPLCVDGICVVNACKDGFENCDGTTSNGCETVAPDSGTACLCAPGAVQACYTGPQGTLGVGQCKGGEMTCAATGTQWGDCIGQVLPSGETCTLAGDEDCDGLTNEEGDGCVCPPNATEPCYTGPAGTRQVGICKDGNWTCNASGTAWGSCDGQVVPGTETCSTPVDDDCDGEVNETGGTGCTCVPGALKACYGGPPGTAGVGPCESGTQVCDALGTGYGPCTGDVLPTPDVCTDSEDNDCNGTMNDGFGAGADGCQCFPLSVSFCYGGPAGTEGVGACKQGLTTCDADGKGWGACVGEVQPSTDHCTDSLDNDCNGVVNDGLATGGTGCVCVPGTQQNCYTGPAGTINVGACHGGTATCEPDGKSWGPCTAQIIPDLDSCLDSIDNDCNGVVNDGDHNAPGCACVPGTIKCVDGKEVTCNAQGDWGAPGGLCNQICKAGQFSCECNQPMQCDVGPPAKWIPKVGQAACNASAGQKCDPNTGTCKALTPIGSTTPTGDYHQYAYFTPSNSVLKITGNVDDVDSFGDYIYVNRGPWYSPGVALDVYKITLLDSDGDGKLEPNQHPDNPNDPGPIEQRVLTFVKTYTAAAPDLAPMGIAHRGEMYATENTVFVLGPPNYGDISEYNLLTKTTTVVADSTANFPLSVLGRGEVDGKWYAGHEGARRVYSYCPAQKAWMAEFAYPDLAGSHMDGLEVIVAPATQVQYVYVSDMTSDFLGQYRRDANGNWVQENLFRYKAVTGASVEGVGFGALNHFWVTSGGALYEIGGGDLSGYLE